MRDNPAVVIDNPRILGALCGPNDSNLTEISNLLATPIHTRGNAIHLQSHNHALGILFRKLIEQLMEIARQHESIDEKNIRFVYTSLESGSETGIFLDTAIRIPISKKSVYPCGMLQAEYIQKMASKDLVFSNGPAGTGKTYLAVAHALMELLSRKKRKIVLTRPVVETGESLGFLPGDLTQKLAPYLRPLYDAMEYLLDEESLLRLQESGQIEVAPLAYMRGRSLKHCCIVLDEAQNTTVEQMKMLLTRIGEGSRAIVAGDLTQIDLPKRHRSGLADAIDILGHLDDVALINFSSSDVVRHPLVRKIIDEYEKHGKQHSTD